MKGALTKSVVRSFHDLGGQDALLCNMTFFFDMGFGGLVPWDQYTWGCRLRIPSVPAGTRQSAMVSKKVAMGRSRRPARDLLAVKRACEPGSHTIFETTRDGQAMEDAVQFDPADPQWECVKSPGFCCDQCPVGKYQHLDGQFDCLSCPYGFTNRRNGSTSLAECCLPMSGFGLYNDRVGSAMNQFGINMSGYMIYGEYLFCPIGRDGQYDLSSNQCDLQRQYVSMIPNVTNDVKEVYSDLGTPGPFCDDVVFSVQPTIGDKAVASKIELDLNCSGCFFDLGPEGSINISLYIVSEHTISPPELKFQMTAPPDISRPRDPSDQAFWSRRWKEGAPPSVLDYTLDRNYRLASFTDASIIQTRARIWDCSDNTTNTTNTTQHAYSIANCPELPKMTVSTARVIEDLWEEFNLRQEAQQSRFACEYEDPTDGVPGPPWEGKSSPKCDQEYRSRRLSTDAMTFNEYTPHHRSGENRSEPFVIGVRVHARVTQGHKGFSMGYRYIITEQTCKAGSSSPTGGLPCSLCQAGKFAAADGHTSCLDCPKGTYSDQAGSVKCLVCATGHSTPDRGSNSSMSCAQFCKAGSFSSTGLEPCQLCPRDTTQSRVGSTYCDECFAGGTTMGKHGKGYTNVFPWQCVDGTDLQFEIEEVKLYGRQLTFKVLWKIPEQHTNVGDIVAVFYGDPWDSIRQLQWTYASATDCQGWVDVSNACRQKGDKANPWSSQTFEVSSAGPGNYSIVYFSDQKKIRILGRSYLCPTKEQLPGDLTGGNFFCPEDTGAWEASTGLFVCNKGEYSTDGKGPCSDCPKGTISYVFAATECISCQQGFYSSNDRTECVQCPVGTSTLHAESLATDCQSCEYLLELTIETLEDIPFCARRDEVGNGSTAMITTTPEPDFCGNGKLRNSEECDDENTRSYDGCSSRCTIEAYYKCSREVGACLMNLDFNVAGLSRCGWFWKLTLLMPNADVVNRYVGAGPGYTGCLHCSLWRWTPGCWR